MLYVFFTETCFNGGWYRIESLPAILLKLQGQDGDTVTIHVPSSAYIESLGKNIYIGRLFLTEGSGAVLGANVMSDHDVVFDPENQRVSDVQCTL